MSSSDAVPDAVGEGGQEFERADSVIESLGQTVARHAESGTLAAASGVVSLARAGRTFLRGNRKRAVVQTLAGLFWVGVALAQRRSGRTPERHTGSELSDVVDTSPDVEEAVEPGGHKSGHATGEEVVDTTDADVAASDLDEPPGVEREAADADVDQRDVATTGSVGDVAETGEADETSQAGEVGGTDETGREDETDEAGHVGDVAETGEAGESESETGSVQTRETDDETESDTGSDDAETDLGEGESDADETERDV